MKKSLLLLLSSFLFSLLIFAQDKQIPDNFYAGNWWIDENFGGELGNILDDNSNLVQNLNLNFIRFGGKDYDQLDPTTFISYASSFLEKVQTKLPGAEPVVQLPFLYYYKQESLKRENNNPGTGTSVKPFDVIKNTTILNDIENIVSTLVTNYNVKYFSIGNEPDLYHFDEFKTNLRLNGGAALIAGDIFNYFSKISERVKLYNNDLQIVGPDLASAQTFGLNSLTEQLIAGANSNITSKIDAITSKTVYYCDIFTIHTYPFPFEPTAGNYIQERADIIDHPQKPIRGKLESSFKEQLEKLLGFQPENPNLQYAVTEFNINSKNPPNDATNANNIVSGVGANSFIAGQWMAEMMAVAMDTEVNGKQVNFMAPWSLNEGDPLGAAGPGDLGLIGGRSSTGRHGRSTYHHFMKMSNTFRDGYVFMGNVTNGDGTQQRSNLKAFAVANSQNKIIVMILKSGGEYSHRRFSDQFYKHPNIHCAYQNRS